VIVGVPPGEPMTDTSVAQAFDELTADDGYRVRAEGIRLCVPEAAALARQRLSQAESWPGYATAAQGT
jgi:hypothetical protein